MDGLKWVKNFVDVFRLVLFDVFIEYIKCENYMDG